MKKIKLKIRPKCTKCKSSNTHWFTKTRNFLFGIEFYNDWWICNNCNYKFPTKYNVLNNENKVSGF